jgi:hypothetical protein
MKRYDFLIEKYVSASIIDAETMQRIILADPTSVDGKSPKVGKYVNWIIRCYLRSRCKQRFLKQMDQMSVDLKKFNNKQELIRHRDINFYRSPQELNKEVKDFQDYEALPKKLKLDYILSKFTRTVYEDERYDVIIPLSVDAANELGGPPLTNWCTNDLSYFKRYSTEGNLFIVRDKTKMVKWGNLLVPQPICQLHFQSFSFYNEWDHYFDLHKFLTENVELKKFFHEIYKSCLYKRPFYYNLDAHNAYYKIYGFTKTDKKKVEIGLSRWARQCKSSITLNTCDWGELVDLLGLNAFYKLILDNVPDTVGSVFISHSGEPLTLPERIFRFKKLKTLRLSCELESVPNVSELKNLVVLSLRNNKIKSISNDIYKLKRLELLDISNNPIEGEIKIKNFIIIK